MDPRSKIARMVTKLQATVDSKCVDVDLDGAFPGACIGAGDFSVCADEQVACRICSMLNAMDDLSRDCDEFDDGVVNGSCTG